MIDFNTAELSMIRGATGALRELAKAGNVELKVVDKGGFETEEMAQEEAMDEFLGCCDTIIAKIDEHEAIGDNSHEDPLDGLRSLCADD